MSQGGRGRAPFAAPHAAASRHDHPPTPAGSLGRLIGVSLGREVDHIRNPLTVIMMLVEMSECSNKEKILKQANEIDGIINQLDEDWLESEKIRIFLKKYYDIGKKE
jgi:hypothetical protein